MSYALAGAERSIRNVVVHKLSVVFESRWGCQLEQEGCERKIRRVPLHSDYPAKLNNRKNS